ncbi:TonB-dependent receptor domain-containing protein [Sulfitobacter donghicola]|uniref:TonB-dependent receptor n=1 Tax=Sulfitobacter donghicola DSW-25 = KCTC 12864 = JCM 14565 TaxID=1300350 RepID=A0A073IG38_9RHOB|nr:TonB-dependent receptor [Sulfitobacter donghicola]KEJ88500.1 TonB-dependent receptor [Sulfitobacter donghicola DSW-25 = KCTC 12864 = JCM 14565]
MYKSRLLLTLTASLWASTSLAQATDSFQLNTIFLETASENDNAVDVESEDIARQNPADVQDLFKSEPTISVGSSIPASQKLYVNGVEETNLNVTIDSSRQNNKVFHHATTTYIDPALLKAVRINPGVAPADAGAGALAGSVAYETRDVGDLLGEDLTFGGFVKSEYDSNGNIFTKSGSVYGRKGGFEYLGFLKIANGDLRSDGSGEDIVGSGTDLVSGLGKLAYEAESGDRFEFSMEQVTDDELRPYRANIALITAGRPVDLTRNYDINRQNFVFTYTDETPTGWWDPTIKLAYSETDLVIDEDTQFSRGTTGSFNGVIQNRFALPNGSITAGVDFYSDEAELEYYGVTDSTYDILASEKSRNIGLFAQARMDLSPRARVSYGLRADFQEFTDLHGETTSDNGFSGNLSGEFDVTDNVVLSAGYSSVWGGVPLAENFILNDAWAYPEDGIEAVTSENIFLAANANFGAWDLSGKLFRTNIDNARTPSWSGGPDLQADLESRGFELGLGYAWANGFARIGYANIDSEIDGRTADSYSGNYLTTPLGEVVTLEVVHTLPQHNLTFGADAQIVLSETNTYDFDTGGAGPTLPSYEVVNGFVEWKPKRNENWTIRGEVNNLFDATYANRATYGQEFATVNPLLEPGRSFKISASLKF